MKIRPMVYSDLAEVVKLHLKTLPQTLSSQIGFNYLFYLYSKLLTQPKIHFCLVALEDKKIIAALTASKNFQKTQTSLIPPISLLPGIFLICISSPKKLLSRFLYQKQLSSKIRSNPVILTLFVDPNYRRQNTGRKLLQSFLNQLPSKRVFVDTQASNKTAQAFYTNLGFKKQTQLFGNIIFSWHERNKAQKTKPLPKR